MSSTKDATPISAPYTYNEMTYALRLQEHWRKTIAEMKRLTAKAEETWIDCSKNCNTKATNLMHQLKADLFVAAGFVDAMDGTDKGNAHATRAVAGLDNAAKEAAACWKCRKGGKYTKEELDADYAEFEKHRKRLLVSDADRAEVEESRKLIHSFGQKMK